LLSLILTAVRMIIERVELKGWLCEVHVFPKDGISYGGKMPHLLLKK
jgi:hypothetical protein